MSPIYGADAQTVGWWRFDEGVAGSPAAGNGSLLDIALGNNGTPFGSPLYLPPAGGCETMGLSFDGSTQRVAIPDSSIYAALRSITVEAVFSTTGYRPDSAGQNQIVLRGDDRAALDPFSLILDPFNRVRLFINNVDVVGTPTAIPLGRVVAVSATLNDSTSIAKIYVDGIEVASGTTSQRPNKVLTGANPGVGIASLQGQAAQTFRGEIFDVRISASALSPSQLLKASPTILNVPAWEWVCPQGITTFHVLAAGSGPLDYQWQINDGSAIGGWANLADGVLMISGQPTCATVSGCSTSIIQVSFSCDQGMEVVSGRWLRCVVSNECSSSISPAAKMTLCASDSNCDGFVNGDDFDSFASRFEDADPEADINGDGFVNGDDYDAFAEAFEAGC